jgi:hypothetical protein
MCKVVEEAGNDSSTHGIPSSLARSRLDACGVTWYVDDPLLDSRVLLTCLYLNTLISEREALAYSGFGSWYAAALQRIRKWNKFPSPHPSGFQDVHKWQTV